MTVFGGDIIYAADINAILNRPVVILSQAANQSIPNNTDTALTWAAGSEVLDTHDYHSESVTNTRIIPTVAGWHQMVATYFPSGDGDFLTIGAGLRLNGATNLKWERVGPNSTSAARSVTVSYVYDFDGSSDYVEVMAHQNNTSAGANNTATPGSFAPKFHMVWLRPS